MLHKPSSLNPIIPMIFIKLKPAAWNYAEEPCTMCSKVPLMCFL